MKNERKVQTYPELLIVLKSIDQLEKRHVASNNWGLADPKVKEFATPKNHPHCHGLSPLRGNTTGKHNGETQRVNTMTTATEKICKLDMKEKLNQLEM